MGYDFLYNVSDNQAFIHIIETNLYSCGYGYTIFERN